MRKVSKILVFYITVGYPLASAQDLNKEPWLRYLIQMSRLVFITSTKVIKFPWGHHTWESSGHHNYLHADQTRVEAVLKYLLTPLSLSPFFSPRWNKSLWNWAITLSLGGKKSAWPMEICRPAWPRRVKMCVLMLKLLWNMTAKPRDNWVGGGWRRQWWMAGEHRGGAKKR